MSVLLRGGYSRGCRLLGGIPLHPRGLRSNLSLRDAQEDSSRHLSANSGQANTVGCISLFDSSSLSSEATPDVHAPVGSFYRASESFCMKSLQHQRNLCIGGGRKDLSWTEWRSFSSLQKYHVSASDSSSPIESTEAETKGLSDEVDEDFDFRNFPALTSSYYENYEPPSAMQAVRKRRVVWQSKSKFSNVEKKLTVDSIPKPRGRTYDFGFGSRDIKPPPLEAGARPQGGFDIELSFDNCEEDACEGSHMDTKADKHYKLIRTLQ